MATPEDQNTDDFDLEVKTAPKLRTPQSGLNLKGLPKSGKGWKKESNKSHKVTIEANKALKMSWDEKMRRKNEQKKMVEINKKMKETKAKRIRGEAERLKEKAKRKELNTFKSASFQIIKNSKKLRKWNKKARSELSKLPTEIFEQVIKNEYKY